MIAESPAFKHGEYVNKTLNGENNVVPNYEIRGTMPNPFGGKTRIPFSAKAEIYFTRELLRERVDERVVRPKDKTVVNQKARTAYRRGSQRQLDEAGLGR